MRQYAGLTPPNKQRQEAIKSIMEQDEEFLRPLVQMVVQAVLEAEMEEALGAKKGERTEGRLGHRSGYYRRGLVTRVGKLELRVPQDRGGRFSTEVFERYQRSEKALVGALSEMYVQGVSTRKVKAISEELCGHEFSASTISALNKKLDGELARFAGREFGEEYPYLIVDARYEKVRENGVVQSRAVQVAIGIDWEGRRQVLGVELANRESGTSWREFLLKLKGRGLRGVRLVVSDDHAGLKKAIGEVLPEAAWQRCYVHFLRNALDHLPRKTNDDCLVELRWLYDRRNVEEARQDILPVAAGAPQAPQEQKYAREAQPRAEETHAGNPDFPQRGELPAADPGTGRGDTRGLDRSAPVSGDASLAGAEKKRSPCAGGMRANNTKNDYPRGLRAPVTLRLGGNIGALPRLNKKPGQ